jgi:hypothetical protein
MSEWPIEEIPDSDKLYMRVHVNSLIGPEKKDMHPGIFREREGSVSVDWEQYSTPEESRLRAPKPLSNGIIALKTGEVRSIEDLQVKHDPDLSRNNRSHSGIYGVDDEIRKVQNRLKLFNLVKGWEISPYTE